MDLNVYQQGARSTARYPDVGSNPIYPTLGLCGEAGEVADKVKKVLRDQGGTFSPEVRERAVRMVLENRGEYPSLWATIESIAPKIGCVPQTLNDWVRQHEVDAGVRDGVSSDERARIKDLEREVKELRKANEILKLASAFFAQAELDRRLKS